MNEEHLKVVSSSKLLIEFSNALAKEAKEGPRSFPSVALAEMAGELMVAMHKDPIIRHRTECLSAVIAAAASGNARAMNGHLVSAVSVLQKSAIEDAVAYREEQANAVPSKMH